GPTTTIPPFADSNILPSCAAFCGPLYDANGGCVPPAVAPADDSVYTACFCSNAVVAPFSTGVAGVCDGACTATADLSSIAGWFRDICSVQNNDDNNNGGDNNGGNQNGNGQTTATTTTRGSSGSNGSNSGANSGGGGDWLSNHWQWVIMLVILVVAIAGIWIGACIWRRRYLRKKERQSTVVQKQSGSASHPSWGPSAEAPPAGSFRDSFRNSGGPGVFMPAAAANNANLPYEEKPKRESKMKKWLVTERT
ncbi:hypothetical protein S40285_03181, partial [Stachybotrys chlorohalonatus IBT 40285]